MDTKAEIWATQVSNITSGSSQAYAPLLCEVSEKKPAYIRKCVSVVDRPTELRLEAAETSRSNDVSAEEIEYQYKRRKGDTSTPKEVMRTVAQAQLQATFYPKFENEMPDREVIGYHVIGYPVSDCMILSPLILISYSCSLVK